MIHLFPAIKKRMYIFCGVYIALLIVLLVLGQTSLPMLALLTIVGLPIVILSQYMNASRAHEALLDKLYNQLDAEGFLRDYAHLLETDVKHPNLYMMIRLHISNAYCALGRFDDAITLLQNIKYKPAKKPETTLLSRYAVASNLCYCAEQQRDLPGAEKYLSELLAIKKELEAIQQTKPEKRRMVFSTALNEQCVEILKTGKGDIDVLRTQVQQNNTQKLHRITTCLWIARAYLAENNRREAEALLEKIAKLAPHLYPGRVAKEILASLPGNSIEADA